MTTVTAFDAALSFRATGLNLYLFRWRDVPIRKIALFLLVASVLFLALNEPAFAQSVNTNAIQNFLQSLVDALTGTLGKTAATLALVAVFISWFFGVIDFRQAMWIICAIVFVGAAPTIVNSLWSSGS